MKMETTEFRWPPPLAIVAARMFDDVWGIRNPIKGRNVKECLGDIDKYTPKTTETKEDAVTKRKFKTKHVSGFTRRLKKTAAEFGDNLTKGEIYHLKKRHERHLQAWRTSSWELEDQTTDCDFIRSLRANRRPAEQITIDEVRRNKYEVRAGSFIPRRKKNISKEERLEVNKLVYRRVGQLATKDPNEDAELWANLDSLGAAANCFMLRKNGSRKPKAEIVDGIKDNLLKTRRRPKN